MSKKQSFTLLKTFFLALTLLLSIITKTTQVNAEAPCIPDDNGTCYDCPDGDSFCDAVTTYSDLLTCIAILGAEGVELAQATKTGNTPLMAYYAPIVAKACAATGYNLAEYIITYANYGVEWLIDWVKDFANAVWQWIYWTWGYAIPW